MIPEPVKPNVRERSVTDRDIIDVLNREVIPTLRAVREALNALLVQFADAQIEITGSRADPEQALADTITALETLGLFTDSTTP